jgi:spermidine synthase
MPHRAGRIALLLFGSGFCALVYQMAWLRELRLVFGSSTAASAAVVAIFIGGLGAGGLLIGRRADTHPRPLWLYARLEAGIALSAAITPALLWVTREAYVAVGGTLALGLVAGTLVRLALAALVLLVPTWLMGGTLPAAARAAETADDLGRRGTALLYGVNTLGAVAGSFVGTFFMLEVFGTRRTLWLACLLNLLVAMAARQMSRSLSSEEPAPSPPPQPAEAAPLAPPGFVLTAAAVVGFAFFLMELVWYRMLGPILGGTIFTFGLILCVALLGIGLGGAAYSLLRSDRPASITGFAYTCLLEAACIALPFALGDRIAILALLLRGLGSIWMFWGHVTVWAIVCLVVVLPPALVAGYQFPMLIAMLGRGRQDVGRQVGLAYAWNTLGAILGSLAGGFGLIPLLSATGAWRSTALTLLALGVGAVVVAARVERSGTRRLAPLLLVPVVLGLLAAGGPTAVWRHSGIGAGRAFPSMESPNAFENWRRNKISSVQWEADGVESSVALVTIGPGLAFVMNGKIDGNARGDAPTMLMSGLVGTALHPSPRRALVVGLGAGGTAGWLAAVPGMERTDVVELEPLVLRVARDCAPINRNVLDNPRVHVSLGDAREALLVSKQRYDIIFSEPSNPYRAGVASLFTREYYQAAAQHLRDDGLFLQWVQGYEVDGGTVRTIYATLHSVFAEVETWQVGREDLLLMASGRPVVHDVARLRQRLAQEPYRSALWNTWRVDSLEGFLAYFVARPSLARGAAAAEPRLNTDDLNYAEFGFARTLAYRGLFTIADLREAARLRGEDRPLVTNGTVDWERVEDERAAFTGRDVAGLARRGAPPERILLAQAFERLDAGDARGARELWRQLGREPRSPLELTLVARVLAELGDEAALPWLDRMRAAQPAEADALLARLRLAQGRFPESLAATQAALMAYRTDAWPHPAIMSGAVDVAVELAQRNPAMTPAVYDLLRGPFVLQAWHAQRLAAAADLASRLDLRTQCAGLIRPLEPTVPWTEAWLTLRYQCYVALGDPRAAAAQTDLADLLAREPVAFQKLLKQEEPSAPSH